MRPRRRTAVALGAFVAVAIAVTWPVAGSAAYAGGLGDPLLGSVLLAWDADRLRHGLRGLWNAPYLFPRRHTLAYTEHLPGIAIFTAPVQWIAANPVLIKMGRPGRGPAQPDRRRVLLTIRTAITPPITAAPAMSPTPA